MDAPLSEQGCIAFNLVDYVMVIVSDMDRSVRFYRDVLGLPLKSESKDWSEFATGTTMLALHGGGKPAVAREGGNYAGTCELGFNIDDLDRVYNELKARGVIFVMAPKEGTGGPIRLAVCLDPDGLPINLTEYVKEKRTVSAETAAAAVAAAAVASQ